MAKGEELSLAQLSTEVRETFSGFPVTIASGGQTYFPPDGIECGHKPKKSFTIEADGACTVYMQMRIGTSGEWCVVKKNGTDSDLTYSLAAGGGSVGCMCEIPADYIRLWIKNTAGATLTIDDIKFKLGR